MNSATNNTATEINIIASDANSIEIGFVHHVSKRGQMCVEPVTLRGTRTSADEICVEQIDGFVTPMMPLRRGRSHSDVPVSVAEIMWSKLS